MRFQFILLIILLLSKVSFAQNTSPKLSNQVIKEDFDYLYQSLKDTHYNLFAFQSKEKYDSLFSHLKSNLTTDSLTLLEATSFFQRLVSFSNTGHCEIDYPASSYIDYAYAGGTVFPLELAFENEKVFIRKIFSLNKEISIGDEILSIDKIPIDDIWKQFNPLVSAERAYFKNAKIEFWSFPRLFYQLKGRKDQWLIQIKNKNNKVINLEVNSISVMDYETNRNGEILNPKKTLKFYGDVAYLNAGQFGSNEVDGEKLFKNFIDSTFTVIKDRKAKNLIIDFRNNPGGHNAYSDYLISYFANKPFKWYSSFSVKTSKILKEHTLLQADTTDEYSKKILNNTDGQIFNHDFPKYKPVEKSKRFNGRVYILVNRQTYSMAAVSAALILDYNFGKIVGEETGESPTLYASQFSYSLPHSGIVVKVPKSYIIRVNGSRKLEGLKPDIYIQDHLLDDNDEILEGLLIKLNRTANH
ncbi:S41 family peptidase [Belliella sp. DSM 111904]|uniref:S41 family peptidase n=1 Tax=Belliella filtrata TaxID=2923435 RepID=A0ABS9UVQ4_9BACT|nr:S41 family peptidase [Belliella filtrata]MCH7408154.1 S41 family peptidase [Belliella filtrata]